MRRSPIILCAALIFCGGCVHTQPKGYTDHDLWTQRPDVMKQVTLQNDPFFRILPYVAVAFTILGTVGLVAAVVIKYKFPLLPSKLIGVASALGAGSGVMLELLKTVVLQFLKTFLLPMTILFGLFVVAAFGWAVAFIYRHRKIVQEVASKLPEGASLSPQAKKLVARLEKKTGSS